MNALRINGIVLIVGAILFLAASFSPISMVHAEPTAAGKLEMIMASPNAWTLSQVLYTLGAIVTVAGVGMVLYSLRQQSPPFLWLLTILALASGTLFFAGYAYFRMVNPQAWVQMTPPVWPFLAYSLLTQAGLCLFGVIWLRAQHPRWPGWLMLGGALFFFILMVIFGDMPPFVYYLLTLVAGVVLYRSGLTNHPGFNRR
jgi:hypothetical protein